MEIRTGPQASLPLGRLPVQLERGQGQICLRALTDLEANPETSSWTHMPSLAANANRVTENHREASPPRSPPHEVNTVALEEQLEGIRITRKRDPPIPSSLHSHLKW